MSESLHKFLEALSDAFLAGRLSNVADSFAYPMPFYCDDGLLVFGAPATLSEGLAQYLDATRAAGITDIVPRILAHGVPSRGYSTVWIEWDHLDKNGKCLRTSQVRYVLYQHDSNLFPKIEMVDYTITAFPEVQDQLPLMATA